MVIVYGLAVLLILVVVIVLSMVRWTGPRSKGDDADPPPR